MEQLVIIWLEGQKASGKQFSSAFRVDPSDQGSRDKGLDYDRNDLIAICAKTATFEYMSLTCIVCGS